MALSIFSCKARESLLAEIETVVEDVGLWQNKSEFIREALDEYIKIHWVGPRFEK